MRPTGICRGHLIAGREFCILACGLMCQQRNADHPSTQQLCQMRHIRERAYFLPDVGKRYSCQQRKSSRLYQRSS